IQPCRSRFSLHSENHETTKVGSSSVRLPGLTYPAFSPALGGLGAAWRATAAAIFDEEPIIFLPIVEGDFFARLDTAQGNEYEATLAPDGLRVRPARMIDIARPIPSRRAVNGPAAVELEQIFRPASVQSFRFLVR
ncbi:MAG: hypothetical protein WCA26_04495, partial [Xanthobacteraceae bacterium]